MSLLLTLDHIKADPVHIRMLVRRLDAKLIDTRVSPGSRNVFFKKPTLIETFGTSYMHVIGLGNLNYTDREKEVAFKDFDGALEILRPAFRFQHLILMCVVDDEKQAHRRALAAEVGAALNTEALNLDSYKLGALLKRDLPYNNEARLRELILNYTLALS